MADAFSRMAAVDEQRLAVERERVLLEERRLVQDQVSAMLKRPAVVFLRTGPQLPGLLVLLIILFYFITGEFDCSSCHGGCFRKGCRGPARTASVIVVVSFSVLWFLLTIRV